MTSPYTIELAEADGVRRYGAGALFAACFGGFGLFALSGQLDPDGPLALRIGFGGVFVLIAAAIAWSTFSPWRERVRVEPRKRKLVFEKVNGSQVRVQQEVPFERIERVFLRSEQRDFANIDRSITDADLLYALTDDGRFHLIYMGDTFAGREHVQRLRRALAAR